MSSNKVIVNQVDTSIVSTESADDLLSSEDNVGKVNSDCNLLVRDERSILLLENITSLLEEIRDSLENIKDDYDS